MPANPALPFMKESISLFAVALLAVFLRIYSRLSTVGSLRHLKSDDYLMIIAVLIYGWETFLACAVGLKFHGLANNGMTDAQRKALSPASPEHSLRIGGSKVQLVGWSTYTSLLWLLKFCMLIFYTRLADGVKGSKLRLQIGFASLGVTYVALILSILLGCGLPFSKNWQIYPDPGNYCQPAISKIDCYVTVILNVVTDIYLMSIPLPMMWKAQIPKKRKILLMAMFSGGLFIMFAGVLRCALILSDPVHGAQQAGSWAVRETFVSFIIGNIPMIYPLALKGTSKVKDLYSSKFSNSSSRSGWSMQKDSNGSSNVSQSGPKKPRRPISFGTPTYSESGEHIVMDHGIKSETTFEVRSVPVDEEMGRFGTPRDKNAKSGYSVAVEGGDRDINVAPKHGIHKAI